MKKNVKIEEFKKWYKGDDDFELRLKIAEANNWDIDKTIEVYMFISRGKMKVDDNYGLQVELFKTDKGIAIKSNLCPIFVVSFRDATKDGTKLCVDNTVSSIYHKKETDAIFDYHGKENTDNLPMFKNISLKQYEYIPSLGQLVIIGKIKGAINYMLKENEGDALRDGFYWSSTEYNGQRVWCLDMETGRISVCNSNVQNRFYIRPIYNLAEI
jgi:hypothetical protein